MNPFGPLLAAGAEEVIQVLIVLAVILVPLIGQLFSWMREAQQQAAKKAEQQNRGGGMAGGHAQQRPRRGREAVEDEIGEFLRRAAERRGGQARPAEPPRPPQRPARPPRPAPPAPARRPIGPPPAPEVAPVEVEVVAEPAGFPDRVSEHVKKYMEADRLSEHASQLGYDLSQTDERLEARLHTRFDHQLGGLSHQAEDLFPDSEPFPVPVDMSGAEPEPLPETAAAGFAALLSDAQSLRNAVVLNEILHRPTERWS